MTILEFMQKDHRACDEIFVQAEQSAAAKDLETTREQFAHFKEETLRHFEREESVLFPAFENRSGNTQGPTVVMRMEHQQMRELFNRLDEALEKGDLKAFLGIDESLMIMLQQHNMKEEQMLYPFCDRTLENDTPHIIDQMKALDA